MSSTNIDLKARKLLSVSFFTVTDTPYITKPFLYPKQWANTYTVFYLITAHTPIKRTVEKFRSLKITASVLFLYFFIKAYVVGTHLNCIDLSMQFKWVPTTYAFINKIRKKKRTIIIKQGLFWLFFNSVTLAGRFVFYHSRVFPVILRNLSAQCGN